MAEQDYDKDFPNLKGRGHRTSDPADYNCIAFAVWDESRWWWPSGKIDEYWPLPIPREETITAFANAFRTQGFHRCSSGRPEKGHEKIALFALTDNQTGKQQVKHAARLEEGKTIWKSKLGPGEDIEHPLDGLVGPCYGNVVAFFKRQTGTEPVGVFSRLLSYGQHLIRSLQARLFGPKPP